MTLKEIVSIPGFFNKENNGLQIQLVTSAASNGNYPNNSNGFNGSGDKNRRVSGVSTGPMGEKSFPTNLMSCGANYVAVNVI